MRKRRRRLLAIGMLVLILYVGSYAVLSRRAYAENYQQRMQALRWTGGFYYFPPEDSDSWRFWNYTCVVLFHPLNVVDRWLGLGKYPASEPLWRLSK